MQAGNLYRKKDIYVSIGIGISSEGCGAQSACQKGKICSSNFYMKALSIARCEQISLPGPVCLRQVSMQHARLSMCRVRFHCINFASYHLNYHQMCWLRTILSLPSYFCMASVLTLVSLQVCHSIPVDSLPHIFGRNKYVKKYE